MEDGHRAIARLVATQLGVEASCVIRLAAFGTNAVYLVEGGGERVVVKVSPTAILRAETWACARARSVGCAAPALLSPGIVSVDSDSSASIMSWVAGVPITGNDPAIREVGADLRRIHQVRFPRFGWLAEASWGESGPGALRSRSWLEFLRGIGDQTRSLSDQYPIAARMADTVDRFIDDRLDALAAVEAGSLCHGDLKPAHLLVDAGRLTGVIDWGDAVIADPVWDLARFAHRVPPETVALLLEGYGLEPPMIDDLPWRLPLYGGLWNLTDAVVDHRLGHPADAALEAAALILFERDG